MSKNQIRWFESKALDAPELKSPQPCKRGIHCDYKIENELGELVSACCRNVHPGEEGTGRRFFPARQLKETGPEATFREQPACVRLTGAANGFYERRRLRLSWAQWCEKKGIPFTPALPGEPFEPVVRVPLGHSHSGNLPRKWTSSRIVTPSKNPSECNYISMTPSHSVPGLFQLSPLLVQKIAYRDAQELESLLRMEEGQVPSLPPSEIPNQDMEALD